MSQQEKPHFSIGHMCAGCEISNYPHIGCVVSRNVEIIKEKKLPNKKEVIEKVLFSALHFSSSKD